MKIIKKIVCLVLVISVLSCSKTKYEFEGTDTTFSIHSNAVNDDYLIYVYFPPNYDKQNTYPLIVGLDGDSEFYSYEDVVSDRILEGKIPASIFVGIGYGSVSKNEYLRNRDYTPTYTEEGPPTGGAADFYLFIKDELIPELHSKYSLEHNSATLLGHSYGGLFTYYTMFQNPDDNPFNKFIPVGASFWYDAGEIFNHEQSYNSNETDLDVKICTVMGNLEGAVMMTSFQEMNERMINRNYSNLKLESIVLKKYGHSRSDYIGIEKGLDYVFSN